MDTPIDLKALSIRESERVEWKKGKIDFKTDRYKMAIAERCSAIVFNFRAAGKEGSSERALIQ